MSSSTTTRRRLLRGIAASGFALTAMGTVTAGGRARYVVTVDEVDVRDRLEREGFEVSHELADGEVLLVVGPDGATDDLAGLSGVGAVSPDVRLGLDEPELSADPDASISDGHTEPDLYPLQWDKQVQDLLEAHEFATGDGTTLSIIDTGIDPDHPDLAPNLDEDASMLFAHEDANPIDDHPWDAHGHGTHVAGTAAATHEAGAEGFGTGIVGTSPDATLVSAKVFWFEEIDGEIVLMTTTGDILRAIDYSAAIGADAANMSLGTGVLPPEARAEGMHVAYQTVCQHATRRGTVVVAAATNADTDLQGGHFALPTSVPGALSVSATGPNDLRTFFSNYGTGEIDVAAPGGGYETIFKTLCGTNLEEPEPGDEDEICVGEDEDEVCEACTVPEWPYPTNLVLSAVPEAVFGEPYAYFAGTSMAAPQVAGLVGLVRQLEPDWGAERVERAIKDGAEDATGESDPDLGAGRVNAARTVERL